MIWLFVLALPLCVCMYVCVYVCIIYIYIYIYSILICNYITINSLINHYPNSSRPATTKPRRGPSRTTRRTTRRTSTSSCWPRSWSPTSNFSWSSKRPSRSPRLLLLISCTINSHLINQVLNELIHQFQQISTLLMHQLNMCNNWLHRHPFIYIINCIYN